MLTFGCFVVWSMAFPFLTLARMLTLNVPWRMTCLSSFLQITFVRIEERSRSTDRERGRNIGYAGTEIWQTEQ
nr:hypothetical protein Q903MT_gene2052 [Picea sitchensis]